MQCTHIELYRYIDRYIACLGKLNTLAYILKLKKKKENLSLKTEKTDNLKSFWYVTYIIICKNRFTIYMGTGKMVHGT